jgi:hypothetical protein
VLCAGAGLGIALGTTLWAGTAFASGSSTHPASALQGQIGALQQRLNRDEAAIGHLQTLLSGVTRSRDGSTLVIAGHGGNAPSITWYRFRSGGAAVLPAR